jgi:UDP-N-acetylmuramate dehydrogenase
VGASPVQNIGAYGVEIMEFIETVEGYHIETGKKIRLTAKECLFTYRNSIFKNRFKNKVLITHVKFRLNKHHQYNTRYPELNKAMDEFPETSIQTIRQAVIQIRKNKLPDPRETGNAGSFFKNPIVDAQQAKDLQQHFTGLPVYNQSDGYCKLSAAWLIERSGWKGKTSGKTGTHKRQPLIIINRGGATGEEILEFALKIQKAVSHQFGVRLEMEVNIL